MSLTREQRHARMVQGRAYGLLILAQVAMGSGGIFGRYALDGMGALSVAAWRLALAASPLLVRLAIKRGPRPRPKQELKLLAAGLVLGVHFAAWTQSLLRLTVGVSTLLVCTSPLWNGLYESFVLKRHLPRSFWVSLAVALGGILMMVQGAGAEGAPLAGQTGLGVVLAILSSMGMATYFIMVGRISTMAEALNTYDTLDIITRTYSYAALALLTASVFEPVPLPALSDWHTWGGVAGMAVITQGLGHTLQNSALRRVRPSIVGFATLLEPLISAVLAAVLFREHLTWRTIVGGTLVLGALGWALRVTAEVHAQEEQAGAAKPGSADPARRTGT